MLVSVMTLGERLREARERLGLSRYAAAKACGISQTSYDKLEGDVTKNPGREMLRALASGLDIPITTLMADMPGAGEEVREPEGPSYGASTDHDKPREVHAVSVPIQAVLVGGPPGEAMEDTGERYDLLHHLWRPGRSVIRIKGDSMWPTFCSGDLLLVDEKAKVKDGDAAVVRIGGESTVKRVSYRKKNAGLLLRGDNPIFPVLETDAEDVQILGRVISIVERKL